MKAFEETLLSDDGTALFARCWLPENMKGILAFSHGLGEYTGRYQKFGEGVIAGGYGLYMADLHGHGQTKGKRGHITNWDETFLADLKGMITRARDIAKNTDVFFGGHSLGGLNAARLLVENPAGVSGAIIMSPAIKTVFSLPKAVIPLINLLSRVTPGLQLPNFLDFDGLSRDGDTVARYHADPYVHKLISPRTYVEMANTQEFILVHAQDVTTPCLFIHGKADRITDYSATQQFFENISTPDKTLKLYEGFYHETHNDFNNEMVYSDIISWMDSHRKS